MQIRRRTMMVLATVALAMPCSTTALAQAQARNRELTYESLKDLPDFSGVWIGGVGGRGGRGGPAGPAGRGAAQPGRRGGPPNAEQMVADIPPLRDQEVLARYKEAITLLASGADNVELAGRYGDVLGGRGGGGGAWRDLGGGFCDPYGGAANFSGRTAGGPESTMEILFTPGRVTITTDHGMIRRIYTDGRPAPKDSFATLTGISIGRWDENALLVETVGLSPKTVIAGIPLGNGLKIDERIYLDAGGILHIDGAITAPEALTGPYRYTQTYSRLSDRNYVMGQFVTDCDAGDRSIDRTNNRQRFDLTPPADLPPPPRN